MPKSERPGYARVDEFKGVQRQAMALVDDIRGVLKYFEPGDLVALAKERGLHQGECKVSNCFPRMPGLPRTIAALSKSASWARPSLALIFTPLSEIP